MKLFRKAEKVRDTFKETVKELETKKKDYLHHRFTKYIVDYKLDDEHLKIYSNIGNYRVVKNTKSNMKKVNQVIIKNKVEIANKIDNYESNDKARLLVFIADAALISGTGLFTLLSFFIGSYIILMCSVCGFGISVLTVSYSMLELYVENKEIQNLKRITGYKRESEFAIPKVDLSSLKKSN